MKESTIYLFIFQLDCLPCMCWLSSSSDFLWMCGTHLLLPESRWMKLKGCKIIAKLIQRSSTRMGCFALEHEASFVLNKTAIHNRSRKKSGIEERKISLEQRTTRKSSPSARKNKLWQEVFWINMYSCSGPNKGHQAINLTKYGDDILMLSRNQFIVTLVGFSG